MLPLPVTSLAGHFKIKLLTLSSKAFCAQALHFGKMKNLTTMETHVRNVPSPARAQLPPLPRVSLQGPLPDGLCRLVLVACVGKRRRAGLSFPQPLVSVAGVLSLAQIHFSHL